MNNEEQDYYCNYLHRRKDNGVIFYVGTGSRYRCSSSSSRSKAWYDVVNESGGFIWEKIATSLTRESALSKEKEIILNPPSAWQLVNAHIPTEAKSYDLEHVSSIVYYSSTSPTGLRWVKDIFSGPKLTTLSAKKDDPAGCINKRGYAQVSLNGKISSCHRLAYLLCNGHLDKSLVIDHVDGNRSNNNISNLRLITQSLNTRNKRNLKVSSSGLVGINEVNGVYHVQLSTSTCGKVTSKRFPTRKHGREKALYLAAKCRHEYLISQKDGSEYSHEHSGISDLLKIITDFERGQGEICGIKPTHFFGVE